MGGSDDDGAARPPSGDAVPVTVPPTVPPTLAPLAATVVGHGRPSATAPEAPATLGRFEIRSKLGEGGMGQVLLAVDPLLGRQVALKVLHRDAGLGAEEAKLRLMREAQGIARLSHEHVIVVHEVGTHEDQVYVAMEYVAGGTLGRWQVGRPWTEVLDMYLRAGRGLVAAHEAGLVHRDFKPDNVLVGTDGRLRVTDFGLVARVGAEPAGPREVPETLALGVSLTRTGTIMGTPRYMAPEQHLGEAVDARADQFAFCAALYEALYGYPPFAGADYRVLSAKVLAGELEPVPAGSPVPAAIRDAIQRGLRRDPDARFASLAELLAVLSAARTAASPAVGERPPRRRRWVPVAGLAVVLAGGTFAWRLRATEPAAPDAGGSSSAAVVPADSGSASAQAIVADLAEGERTWALGVDAADQGVALAKFREGNAALGAGQAEVARGAYADALARWNHPAIHFNLAMALMQLDRLRPALEHLDAALIYPAALGADQAQRARDLRLVLIETLRGGASGSARAVRPAERPTANAWFELGKNKYGVGEFDAAVKAFERGIEVAPDASTKATLLFNIAHSYRQANRCRDAVSSYQRYLSFHEANVAKPLEPERRKEIEARIAELAECARREEKGSGLPE